MTRIIIPYHRAKNKNLKNHKTLYRLLHDIKIATENHRNIELDRQTLAITPQLIYTKNN